MYIKHPINIAQIGCGYWGPNLLRNFSALTDCVVKYVVEASPERRAFVQANYPRTIAVESLETALTDAEVDAVVIATPAKTHFPLAQQALNAGKHVFVEKPLATKVAEVDELALLAEKGRRVLMVGHTFLYHAPVLYVKQLITSGELGDIRYIYSQRLNLGRIRSDIDTLWNFAPHDVSIIQYWLGDPEPLGVFRLGMDYIQEGVEDVVFLNILYPNKVIANVHVSWLDPQKVRKMVVVGSRRMVVYDDVAEDKIAIYDKGIDRKAVLGENMDFDRPQAVQFNYRSGDILLPQVKVKEPLQAEAQEFLDSIRQGRSPLTNAHHARRVIGVLEQARVIQCG